MTFPSTIKVIALTEKGDFDVIKKLELPFPKPNLDQILIKVKHILFLDLLLSIADPCK